MRVRTLVFVQKVQIGAIMESAMLPHVGGHECFSFREECTQYKSMDSYISIENCHARACLMFTQNSYLFLDTYNPSCYICISLGMI